MGESRLKTWLVTGGAGFIGSNFIRYILKQADVQVINLEIGRASCRERV